MTLHDKRIKEVAFKLGVSEEEVQSCVDLLYLKAKQEMESFSLSRSEIISKEEFKKTTKIIKIPHIGFLVPRYSSYLKMTMFFKAKKAREEENKNNQ